LADMLEDHVDALLLRQLANDAFETVLTIVDHVIGTERAGTFRLVIGADGGDNRAAHALGKLDRGGTNAGAARVDQDRFARLEPGVVEQHVLDRAKGNGCDGSADLVNAGRCGYEKAGGQVDLFLREAIQMEAMDAAHMLAEIITAFAARA